MSVYKKKPCARLPEFRNIYKLLHIYGNIYKYKLVHGSAKKKPGETKMHMDMDWGNPPHHADKWARPFLQPLAGIGK
jgi:hypothetical protein